MELGLSAEVKVETVTISGKETTAVRSIENGIYLGFEVRFDGIILTVSGEVKFEKIGTGKKKISFGPEISGEPLPPLIDPCSIWKGEVYPFRETNKE